MENAANGIIQVIQVIATVGAAFSAVFVALITRTTEAKRKKAAAQCADQQQLQDTLTALSNAVGLILQDMIERWGLQAIRAEKITSVRRDRLLRAHSIYHDGLNQNGELDGLMERISEIEVVYAEK